MRNAVWCFGDSAGIDFSDLSNVHPITSAMDGRGTCVFIADSTGQLLLYAYSYGNGAVGSSGKVRNKYHRLIQKGDSIVG
ncbi:MAG: hypothetical protein IT242_10445 [Bacteroidia bacterium]|nr:hypothetical protein [Bacteroidia bacterium]